MARVVSNDLIKGISGIIGEDLCFRQIGGRTFVVKRPRRRPTCTTNQSKQRSRFNQAVYYARTVLKDPIKRDAYTAQAKEANLRSAYLAAMQDAMRNPEITGIYTESYHGNAGDAVVIAAAQPFKITEAIVVIKHTDGSIIERGTATRHHNAWVYISTNQNHGECIISVVMKNRLGRMAERQVIVNSG